MSEATLIGPSRRCASIVRIGIALAALVLLIPSSADAWEKGKPLGPKDVWHEYDSVGPAGLVVGTPSDRPSSDSSGTAARVVRYAIQTPDWVTLRNYPGHYVVANGFNGWGFDAVDPGNTLYRFGFVKGSADSKVEACVYLRTDRTNPTGGTPFFDCSNIADIRPSDFMSFWNGNIAGVNCAPPPPDGDGQCDGSPATIAINSTSCQSPDGRVGFYSNVKPWAPNVMQDGRVTARIPNGQSVRYRYVTKDNRFALIRDPNSPLDNQWGFIPSGCIASYSPVYYNLPAN